MTRPKLPVLIVALLCGAIQCVSAQPKEPGGTPESALLAVTNPDEFAWRMFLYTNHQAKIGVAGEADETKSSLREYDPDHPVVWESWGLASGLDLDFDSKQRPVPITRNVSEVFKNPATKPLSWDKLDRGTAVAKTLSRDFKRFSIVVGSLGQVLSPGAMRNLDFSVLVAPLGSDPGSDEVRMNRSTYETVRTKRLWSLEGVDAAFSAASSSGDPLAVRFEQMSKEVKARWVLLAACNADPNCADKKRYHWRTVKNPATGQSEIWGLASLGVITKDLPNWFWSDFGHIDCETAAGACALDNGEPAKTPLVDATTNGPGGNGPSGRNGVRTETVGSKWENYRLRGTQIDYVRTDGRETILSNPVIENGIQRTSCITCHLYASVGVGAQLPNVGTSLPGFAGKPFVKNIRSQSSDVGPPKCQRFFQPGGVATGQCPDVFGRDQPLYLHTDFLWSIPFRAFSEKP